MNSYRCVCVVSEPDGVMPRRLSLSRRQNSVRRWGIYHLLALIFVAPQKVNLAGHFVFWWGIWNHVSELIDIYFLLAWVLCLQSVNLSESEKFGTSSLNLSELINICQQIPLPATISSRSVWRDWTLAPTQVPSLLLVHRLAAAARAENNARLLFFSWRKIVFHFLQLFHRGHRGLWASSWATAAPKPARHWWMCVAWATAASSNVWECSRWSWVAWATGTSNGGSHGRGLWWAVGGAVPASHEQDQWWR